MQGKHQFLIHKLLRSPHKSRSQVRFYLSTYVLTRLGYRKMSSTLTAE